MNNIRNHEMNKNCSTQNYGPISLAYVFAGTNKMFVFSRDFSIKS